LAANEFAIVMCDGCSNTLPVVGQQNASVALPTVCGCGGNFKPIEKQARATADLLGFSLKREGELEVGDIVEPFNWGMGGGWNRQLILAVDHDSRKITFYRPMGTGTFVGGTDGYLRAEKFEGYYSERPEDQSWYKMYGKDFTTYYAYLEERRRWAEKEQLDVYWLWLHSAIERECVDQIDNIHELRHACMELEQSCMGLHVQVPGMPTKEEAAAHVVTA